jgi:hypothetical protein
VLKWVLPQPQLLEKRAFVGYYLSFPDVSRIGGCPPLLPPCNYASQCTGIG